MSSKYTGVQGLAQGEGKRSAKASNHASKCEHACARARVCVCERVRARARARSLMATLPGGGPAEDGRELRSHACGVAKVEARCHAPGVGRIVIVTARGHGH